MDALADLLNTVHLSGSLYFRSILSAPWGMEVPASDTAQFHVIRRGRCWLLPTETSAFAAQQLEAGDIVVLPHGDAHILADERDTPIVPLQDLVPIDLTDPEPPYSPAPLILGGGGPQTTLVCGYFKFDRGTVHPMLSVLPAVLNLRGEGGRARSWLESSLDLITEEAAAGRPGGATLVNRLTEALFVQVIQAYIEALDHPDPNWLTGLRDPQIAKALGLIHGEMGTAWTVGDLAARVGMSRSAFSARFADLVGEPPLHYLTRWRMQVAANHLQGDRLTLAEIAETVGYGAEASFSKVFKRYVGVAPGSYRRQAMNAEAVSR